MEKVYIESTIPSYYASDESNDIFILSHQRITQKWWDNYKSNYQLFISDIVLEEVKQGDPIYSKKRLDLIKDIELLVLNPSIKELVNNYVAFFNLNENVIRDIFHIAFTVFYEIDYLITWNCKHIANAHFIKQLLNYNLDNGLFLPTICTPEELMED
jgi:hypothetical protein